MNTADDRRKAGIFLLVSLGLLLLLTGILAGVRFLSRDRNFTAEFRESVAGLEPSSTVKYSGVPVGTVTGIHFDPDDIQKIRVDFKVRPEVPMKIDTRAVLQSQGITGILYLELHGGTTGAEDLKDGDVIPSDPSFSSKITGIAKDLSELVTRMNSFVSKNDENLTYAIADFRASAGSIRDTLVKVDQLIEKASGVLEGGSATLADARKAIEDVRTEMHATGEAVRKVVSSLDEIARDPELKALPGKASKTLDLVNENLASVDFRGVVDRVNLAVDEFRRIEENLDRASAALARTAEDGQQDVRAAMADIRAAADHVKEATRLLKDDPSRILSTRPVMEKPVPDPIPPLPEEHR